MKINDFDYNLSPEFIAQIPVEPRDQSRIMVLNRSESSIEHNSFFNIVNYLQRGDVLVFNDSRVMPARLYGIKHNSNTKVELLLLRRLDNCLWEALVKPGKKIAKGTKIKIVNKAVITKGEVFAEVVERGDNGIRTIHFSDESLLEKMGQVPLPPYIHTPLSEPERYQTIYARIKGSAAAPTAGLHFTPDIFDKLQKKGVQFTFVTLHIGLDTFQPVRVENPLEHPIHMEYGEVSPETAELLNQSKEAGKRIIAVGTSTVRIIEAASQSGIVQPISSNINLFILPGYQFLITDAMITNFHLPRSTLLMLVSAFAGRDFILQAYEQAKTHNYRFYSFGDAMLIL